MRDFFALFPSGLVKLKSESWEHVHVEVRKILARQKARSATVYEVVRAVRVDAQPKERK
jgi:hypothetical protein